MPKAILYRTYRQAACRKKTRKALWFLITMRLPADTGTTYVVENKTGLRLTAFG
jgi:hypothetical protein